MQQRDCLPEFVVIVASILLAFGIDAWWAEKQERSLEQHYLVGLLLDLRADSTENARQIRLSEGSIRAAEALLLALGQSIGR